MYLINTTYFSQELTIPNIKEEEVYGTTDSNSIGSYIDRYACELLEKALGITHFRELDKNITDGELKGTAPDKWIHLIEGRTLIINEKKYYWQGLLTKKGMFKESLLANYVYCKWLQQTLTTITGIGEVKGEAVNTSNVNSTNRIVSIWNDFIVKYQGRSSINSKPFTSYHNGVRFTDYLGSYNDTNLSLVDYLRISEDFKDVNPYIFKVKNSLGL